MTSAVLDASALLALLRGEPGKDAVSSRLQGSLISTVNLSEVVSKTIEKGGLDARDAWNWVMALPITPVDFDLLLARRAAELRAVTRANGLSFGDRACLALAERERLPAITADRQWRGVDLDVEIVLIR
jgi:ribonuclease VapC